MLQNNWKQKFLWGASTSAYQFEGAYDVENKGLNIHDLKIPEIDSCDFKIASDHFNRWKEDIKLLSELGLKAYRFSISWTRIFPNGDGEINQKGIEFYNNLIDELIKFNIEPIVTIYHFDTPLELEKSGGWINKKRMIDAYVNYADVLFKNFGDRVKYWLTINELNMMVMYGHVLSGKSEKQGVDPLKGLFQEAHNMFVAQAKVIDLLHTKYKNQNSFIGPAPNIAPVYSIDSNPVNIDAAYKANCVRNLLYLDIVVFGKYNKVVWNWFKETGYTPILEDEDMEIIKKAKPDFIAFNYYDSMTVSADFDNVKINFEGSDQQNPYDIPNLYKVVSNPNLTKTDFGWEIDPFGLRQTCRELYDRYKLPLIITENGIGGYETLEKDFTVNDQYRIDFYEKHINELVLAIDEDVEIFGYCPWSAIDLVSTHQGIKKRYGFVYVDKNDNEEGTLDRFKKQSFEWYKNLISKNGNII